MGRFAPAASPFRPGASVRLEETHTYSTPGAYFPVVRVTSQRKGDASTPFDLVQNLPSVRVVVH